MLNIGSLTFGVFAWIFAVLAITTSKTVTSHRNTVTSFSLCSISLLLQLFEINRRVLLGDYVAIEDTIRAVLIASSVLVSVTVILNLVALVKVKAQESRLPTRLGGRPI